MKREQGLRGGAGPAGEPVCRRPRGTPPPLSSATRAPARAPASPPPGLRLALPSLAFRSTCRLQGLLTPVPARPCGPGPGWRGRGLCLAGGALGRCWARQDAVILFTKCALIVTGPHGVTVPSVTPGQLLSFLWPTEAGWAQGPAGHQSLHTTSEGPRSSQEPATHSE